MLPPLPNPPTNPQIPAFIRRLIVLLNATSIIWLYNDRTAALIDSLIVNTMMPMNTDSQHHHHYAHNIEVADALLAWCDALPVGPDYVCIYIVGVWRGGGINVTPVQVENALNQAFERLLCRHVFIHLEMTHHRDDAELDSK